MQKKRVGAVLLLFLSDLGVRIMQMIIKLNHNFYSPPQATFLIINSREISRHEFFCIVKIEGRPGNYDAMKKIVGSCGDWDAGRDLSVGKAPSCFLLFRLSSFAVEIM